MTNSLKRNILNLMKVRFPKEVRKVEIEDYGRQIGFDAENAARRTRELVNEGYIERLPGRYATYRYIQREPKVEQTEEDRIKQLAESGVF